MQYSGYNKQFRYQVINSSINAYNNLINKETAGVRPLFEIENGMQLRGERW